MATRAHRGDKLQPWLAAWVAVLLVLAPLARPAVPVDLAGIPAGSHQALVAHDGARGDQPAAAPRPAQPFTAGILSRLSLLETTLGLPPLKPPPLRAAAAQPALARGGASVLGGEPRGVLERSSVGTARTPTGPPV